MNREVRRSTTRAMARVIVQLRGWPGMDGYRAPRAIEPYARRLFERLGLVVFAAAREGSPDEFGMGAFLVVNGSSLSRRGVIVPDDYPDELRFGIEDLLGEFEVTATGQSGWEVVTLAEFFEPYSGVFAATTYTGAGWTIGADLGRTFGLLGAHCTPRRGRNVDGWEIWPPGWGTPQSRGRTKRCCPHRPQLRGTARRSGWRFEFGPCEGTNGRHVGKTRRLWRGEWIDVLTLAYALDADRGASFEEHCENFGLQVDALPTSVTIDTRRAADVAAAVTTIHGLVVALDHNASAWFTSSQDRREWRGRVDLARTASPGSLASDVLRRAGVTAPLRKFKLTQEDLGRWAETYHGGMVDADPRSVGVPFEGAVLDVTSCFPLVAHLVGWWRLLCAKSIRRQVVTEEFVALCHRAVEDPLVLTDPAVWRRYGVAIVEDVVPAGEWFLVEVEDPQRPDGRLEWTRVHSPDRPMHSAALDLLATCVRSQKVPKFGRAVRLLPVGHQEGIESTLAALPGLVLNLTEDPAMALTAHMRSLKDCGDTLLAGTLRTVILSLVYGNLVRFDEVHRKVGATWARTEVPGPYNFLPLGSAVSSGSHLLLVLLEHLVADRGSAVLYRDTDSSIVPFSPFGGELVLPDGPTVRQLSASELDEIVRTFASLSPSADWPVWKVTTYG
jgi:hypothetical protein